MIRAWLMSALLVLCGLLVGASLLLGGSSAPSAVVPVLFLLLAWTQSPLFFPRRLDAAEARRRSAADGRPVIYWRPGCTFCLRLRIRLGRRARRAYWVDIWRDPEGAAVVRAANGGDETVPTVVVADRPHTNPDPGWVRVVLDALPAPGGRNAA
ncbi:glutaredoxin domain-containing protein [Streptomyces sp. NPDC046203]|uniref:glutaredoxin domain-containing protein n=1 Tax=Streptomyces sp. NPDC046203 TaxID=3154602 RepID=UPI0033CD49A4